MPRVPVKVKIYSGLPHAFWIFPDISTTQIAEDDLLEGVKWLVKQIPA
jgi:acetyl esterase